MAIAGRVAIVPKGEYSNAVTYDKLDLVMFNNDAYVAKKASTGIEPTNDEYWMLILNNVVAEDLNDIINGTTPVGKANDADTVDGKHAKEFMQSGAGSYGATIFGSNDVNNWTREGTWCSQGGTANVPSGTDGWGDLLVFGSGNGHKTQLFRPWNAVGLYWRRLYGESWNEWKKIADANKFLPLDGSKPMSGSLGLNVNGGGFRISPTNIQTQLVANGSATQGFRVLSIVTHDYTANDADALRFEGYDGNTNATYTILHTGNKPSGSYTGNGSATQRTVNVGGIGNTLVITSNYGTALVTSSGGIMSDAGTVTPFGGDVCYFYQGSMGITSDNDKLNKDGVTYTYQVL